MNRHVSCILERLRIKGTGNGVDDLTKLSRLKTSNLVRKQLECYQRVLLLDLMRVMNGAILLILLGNEIPSVFASYNGMFLADHSLAIFVFVIISGLFFELCRFKFLVKSKTIDYILGFRGDSTGTKKSKRG